MTKERSAWREEQEDPLEPWETPESRTSNKAWRSDTDTRETHVVKSTSVLATNLLEWAVTNAPSVLRDLVVASLAQQVHELRGVIAALSQQALSTVPIAGTVPRDLVDLILAASESAAKAAFGKGFMGLEAELKFDHDFGGAYVAVSLNVRQLGDTAALERAQTVFYEKLQDHLPTQAAERAVFFIMDRATK